MSNIRPVKLWYECVLPDEVTVRRLCVDLASTGHRLDQPSRSRAYRPGSNAYSQAVYRPTFGILPAHGNRGAMDRSTLSLPFFFLFPSYVINSSSRTRSGLRRIGFMRGWISTRAAFPRRKKWPARTPTRLPGCLSNTPRWAWVSSQDLLSSLSHGDYSTV